MSDVTSLVLTEADTFKYLLISILTFFMYLWLCWVFAAALGLSLVASSWGCSSFQCAGFSCGGFFCCRTWTLGTQTQQLWRTGLVAPRHVESSQARDRTCFPCIGGWILIHCATREVLLSPSSLLTAAAAAKSLQSCPTLCDPIDGSPPGSPAPGILQARGLEWGAIAFSVITNRTMNLLKGKFSYFQLKYSPSWSPLPLKVMMLQF